MHTPLPPSYFARETLEVARDLVGALLVHRHDGERLVGRIVETEAYTQEDPACHGSSLVDPATGERVRDGRGTGLFRAPGTAYVYLIYGMYWLLNVVTEPEGTCGAVLIRAVEPIDGREVMRGRRKAARRDVELTNGPGKLTQAFAIGELHHGTMLTQPPLFFAEGGLEAGEELAASARVGISKATERPWRFFIEGHAHVSPGVPSDRR